MEVSTHSYPFQSIVAPKSWISVRYFKPFLQVTLYQVLPWLLTKLFLEKALIYMITGNFGAVMIFPKYLEIYCMRNCMDWLNDLLVSNTLLFCSWDTILECSGLFQLSKREVSEIARKFWMGVSFTCMFIESESRRLKVYRLVCVFFVIVCSFLWKISSEAYQCTTVFKYYIKCKL